MFETESEDIWNKQPDVKLAGIIDDEINNVCH